MKASLLHARAYTPRPAAPAALTQAQASSLSQSRRVAYAREVRRFLNGHYFDSERDRRIRAFLQHLIDDNAEALTGTRDVAILTGPNVMGKSTLLYQLVYAVHRHHVGESADPAVMARRNVTRRIGGHDREVHPTHAPVLFLSLQAATTVTKFNELVVEALDYERSVAKKATVLDLLLQHGVRLLVIDDLHQLILTEKLGRYALDHLKAVVTAGGEYGITVIFAGANLSEHKVMDDPQVTGRAYELTVTPYDADTRAGAVAWQRFLKECGSVLAPHLPMAGAGMLDHELPGLILERTHGRMQSVVSLLRRATTAAIEDGTFAVTQEHVRAVPLAKLTQDGAAAAARRPVRSPQALHPTVTLGERDHGSVG